MVAGLMSLPGPAMLIVGWVGFDRVV